MAHHASAIRQERRSIRHQKINKKNKSSLRTEVRKVRELVDNQDKAGAQKALPRAYAVIDKSVKKGTIHANTGARYKSRLTRRRDLVRARR